MTSVTPRQPISILPTAHPTATVIGGLSGLAGMYATLSGLKPSTSTPAAIGIGAAAFAGSAALGYVLSMSAGDEQHHSDLISNVRGGAWGVVGGGAVGLGLSFMDEFAGTRAVPWIIGGVAGVGALVGVFADGV